MPVFDEEKYFCMEIIVIYILQESSISNLNHIPSFIVLL